MDTSTGFWQANLQSDPKGECNQILRRHRLIPKLWQAVCGMKTEKRRTAPYRHFVASKKKSGTPCTKTTKEKVVAFYLSAAAVSFRDELRGERSQLSIGADAKPSARLASRRHPRRLRVKTSS